MNTLAETNEYQSTPIALPEVRVRQASESPEPRVFADIYRDDTNIAIWQRTLSEELLLVVNEVLKTDSKSKFAEVVTPKNVHSKLCNAFGGMNAEKLLTEDITLLVDMFCCVFDLNKVGLRLTALDRAMCPRFHFDRIPC